MDTSDCETFLAPIFQKCSKVLILDIVEGQGASIRNKGFKTNLNFLPCKLLPLSFLLSFRGHMRAWAQRFWYCRVTILLFLLFRWFSNNILGQSKASFCFFGCILPVPIFPFDILGFQKKWLELHLDLKVLAHM